MPENKWLVGIQGDDIVIGLPMRVARLNKQDALLLAAWLVAMASSNVEEDFEPILNAVLNA
jgi:hypothetical protein